EEPIASGDLRTRIIVAWSAWPGTAKVCMRLTYAQVVSCVVAHAFWQVGPVYKDSNNDELQLFELVRYILVIPLVLVSLYQFSEMLSSRPRHRALVITRVSMFEFGVKITYYSLLSTGYDLAYQNQRCYDYRPIYVTRWIGWTFAIPTLVFMNLYPIMDHQHALEVLVRLLPQQLATAAYCWACCLGCIVLDPWMGWYLNVLGCVAYVAVIADEVVFVCEQIMVTAQPVLKGYSIIVKECIFVIYTGVWLLGNWGYATSYSCQRFYSVSDVSLKSVMATLLFFYWNVDRPEKARSPLEDVMEWMSLADLDQEYDPFPRGKAVPSLPRAGKESYCTFAAGEATQDADEEWNHRLQRSGVAGRLVAYDLGDRPQDELLLRGGAGHRVAVSFVRGKAEQAGVKVGDVLVSINGRKDFAGLCADDILYRLRAPVTLVFLGFIGKWHAEVRLSSKESCCGLDSKVPIPLGRPGAPLQVIEEVVFQPSTAPLLLAVEAPAQSVLHSLPGDTGDVSEIDEFQDLSPEFTQAELASIVQDTAHATEGDTSLQRAATDGMVGLTTPRAAKAAEVAAVYELRGQEAKRLVERVRVEAQAQPPTPSSPRSQPEVDTVPRFSELPAC
ncbi:unnamed protein product, partial [Effrenium voratum]